MFWEQKITTSAIRATTEVLSRACDLVEEARWRYDLENLVFRERMEQDESSVWLNSLWVLGEASNEWVLAGCRDVPGVADARMDAGAFVIEGRSLSDLMRVSRGRKAYGHDVYDIAFLLATDMLLA